MQIISVLLFVNVENRKTAISILVIAHVLIMTAKYIGLGLGGVLLLPMMGNWINKSMPKKNNKQKRIERVEKYINTKENWCPTYPDGTVRVSFLTYINYKKDDWYRVCVWGYDDFGMELDTNDKKLASKTFETIIDYCTITKLEQMGFVRA